MQSINSRPSSRERHTVDACSVDVSCFIFIFYCGVVLNVFELENNKEPKLNYML